MNTRILSGKIFLCFAWLLMSACGSVVITFPVWLAHFCQKFQLHPVFIWVGVAVWFIALMLTVRACAAYSSLREEELAREEATEHYVTLIEYSDGEVDYCELDENPEGYLAMRQVFDGSLITAKYSTVPRP